MQLVQIEARDIPDAWFQAVYKLLETGFEYEIEHGSYVGSKRLEFDYITIYIKYPQTRPLEPHIPVAYGIPDPVEPGYIEKYIPYLMTPRKGPKEQYTYGERLSGYRWIERCQSNTLQEVLRGEVNQIDHFIELLKGTPNTNQAILQVAQPQDCLLSDPPCLRHIDMRVKDGKLIFYIYFRCVDARQEALYRVGGRIYYGSLKRIHESFQKGGDVEILSFDKRLCKPVWGKIKTSVLRTENEYRTIRPMSEEALRFTRDHWVLNENFQEVQVDVLREEDYLVRLSNLESLERSAVESIDLFELFEDVPGYYLRNLSLEEVKSFCVTEVKESWRDQRILPLSAVDVGGLPHNSDRITIGAARSPIERQRFLHLTYSVGYILGAWEANGWFKDGNCSLISIGKYRQEVFDTLIEHAEKEGLSHTVYEQDSVLICHIGDKLFFDVMNMLGFVGGASVKNVPDFVFNASVDFQRGFFDGWNDGDAACTISKALACKMRVVASLAGIKTSLYTEPPRVVELDGRLIRVKKSYRVGVVSGERYVVKEDVIKKRIKEITEEKERIEVVDFTVEGYGLFCIGSGSIIVHNSWDLWNGFPANLGGIVYLQEHMAGEIGVEPGPFVCASKGLHLYRYIWEFAEVIRGKTIEEFRKEK